MKKGFTLIELLVVISIIAILSAVVMAAVNTARGRGNNAAMIRGMDTIRKQAELYYNDNNLSYGSTAFNANAISYTCTDTTANAPTNNIFANTVIQNSLTQIASNSGSTARTNLACVFNATSNRWVFAMLLRNSQGVQCIDDRGGAAKTYSSATAANDTTNVIDLTNARCR